MFIDSVFFLEWEGGVIKSAMFSGSQMEKKRKEKKNASPRGYFANVVQLFPIAKYSQGKREGLIIIQPKGNLCAKKV